MGSSGVEDSSGVDAGDGKALGKGGCTVQCPSREALVAVGRIAMLTLQGMETHVRGKLELCSMWDGKWGFGVRRIWDSGFRCWV